MINKPLPFKDLSIRIPIIIPIKGGYINQGSTLHATYLKCQGNVAILEDGKYEVI